ncbi:MAG: EamA family transporter, partial [Alphaproteobacteria bacterium]|nr:EamA family transporter [Alphaproteobacteria bacterium]
MMTGIIFALLGGISLGGITSFAALSYQHGVAPLELIALRGVIAAVIMVSLCLFQRQPLFLNQSGWRYGGLVGLSLAMVGFGYMGSVAYISPGLAVAILYLYPIIVLVVDSLKLRQMPPMLTIIGFSVALFGIVICVGIGGSIHPIGIGLALMAS